MKKRYSLMILAFSTAVVMLLASCAVKTQETPGLRAEAADRPQTADPSMLPEENPAWQVVSTAPEDFGIVYDDVSMDEIRDYLLDKLAAYLLGADGVYAEAAHEEFYQRFLEAPDAVMSYLVLVDEQSRQTLCWAVAWADAVWYEKTPRFQEILDTYVKFYRDSPKTEILARIKELYQEMG